MTLLYSCFLAIWRRWFGGGFDKLPDNRFLQHVIGFCGACLFLWTQSYSLEQILLASFILQGLFWARSHGCCFDYGHGTVDIKRYEQLWYWRYVKKYIPENMLYGYACDFLLMSIRYTIPAILLSIVLISVSVLFAGLAVTGVYALLWVCYDLGLTRKPTEMAEYLSGFIVGVLL